MKFTEVIFLLLVCVLPVFLVGGKAPAVTPVSEAPTASIYINGDTGSFLGLGKSEILVLTSKPITVEPSDLILLESDGSFIALPLKGEVPGSQFTATLVVDEQVAEGPAQFSFSEEALISDKDLKGNEIVFGQSVRIDKTPPSAPQNLRATFSAN